MHARGVTTAHVLRAALVAGTVAGVIDIGAAALINRVSAKIILQAVASGLLGMASYAGGAKTVFLGLVLQLLLSVVIASVYAIAAAQLNALLRRPYVFGLLYGVAVFFVMNLIVLPLSAFGPKPTHVSALFVTLNILAMLLFGTVVGTLVRWSFIFSARSSAGAASV